MQRRAPFTVLAGVAQTLQVFVCGALNREPRCFRHRLLPQLLCGHVRCVLCSTHRKFEKQPCLACALTAPVYIRPVYVQGRQLHLQLPAGLLRFALYKVDFCI